MGRAVVLLLVLAAACASTPTVHHETPAYAVPKDAPGAYRVCAEEAFTPPACITVAEFRAIVRGRRSAD